MTSVSLFPLLIQISSLRRNNDIFTSVIDMFLDLMSRYKDNRLLFWLRAWTMTRLARMTRGAALSACPTHEPRKPFYTTPCCQKNHASRGNYVFELRQVMILRLSRVGRTSCDQMVGHGRVHFMFFQNFILLCMKS